MKLHHPQGSVLGLVLALGLLAGCAGTAGVATTAGTGSGSPSTLGAGATKVLQAAQARGPAGSPAAAGSALDTFGSALLSQQSAAGNTVLSPYSIYAVLAMARAGAKGETASQLDAVLGAASAQAGYLTAIDQAVAAALAQGKAPAGDPNNTDTRPETLDVANSVWLSPTLPVHQGYLDALARDFGVGLHQVDYAVDPEAARKAINEWVSQRTGKLIPELLARGTVDADTVLTLVNAMHLSAPWQTPFSVGSTPLMFTTSRGTTVSSSGMSIGTGLSAAKGAGWTSVTVPYRGGGLAMTIVLPDARQFGAVRAKLATVLPAATGASPDSGREISLTMPMFRTTAGLSLAPALKTLGVKDIFDGATADLSGIAGPPHQLYATELVHQAVIGVDDKGTEAAAATALTMAVGAARPTEPPLDVTVDRPFFYVVHDTVTGAPLFLGQVTDPTK